MYLLVEFPERIEVVVAFAKLVFYVLDISYTCFVLIGKFPISRKLIR
jgi:hypothetical protein